MNNNLVLLCGKSATGKSASLQMLDKPEGVMYLNCENNKKLPFKSKFQEFTITDPTDVPDAIDSVQDNDKVHTIVIDSLTYLMDMFESTKVLTNIGQTPNKYRSKCSNINQHAHQNAHNYSSKQ